MSDRARISQTWLAMVNSGNIRYQALPVADIPLADDAAWDQLYNAAGSPAADHWVCGFQFSIATGLIVAENEMLIDVGWGGADHATNAPTNIIIANWPVAFSAVAAALGPFMCQNQMLPYPVRVPVGQVSPGSRMVARIAASPIGGQAFTAFRVILATAIGS